jgi:ubiquinone/menaquinone biosynthesis C-methylase UbiE
MSFYTLPVAARRGVGEVKVAQGAAAARAFDVVARVYDTPALQRVVYRPSQDIVVASLRLAQSRRVADVGCGTGQLTARIAAELDVEETYGFDVSEGMLAKARERSDAVRWTQAPAEDLPLPDGALDAVVSTEAFHFFDRPVALREFHRVLAPGGVLIVASVNTAIEGIGGLLRWAQVEWSTRDGTRALVQDAGFEVVEQRRVGRALGSLFPTYATIASRPAASRGGRT